jgi:hypothetical protein
MLATLIITLHMMVGGYPHGPTIKFTPYNQREHAYVQRIGARPRSYRARRDGRPLRLRVPPGTYELFAWAPGFDYEQTTPLEHRCGAIMHVRLRKRARVTLDCTVP